MGHSKDSGKYERVLALVEQVRPWCRTLESDVVEKRHNFLVASLDRCCRFLVEEINHFGEELFVRRICSSLFSQERINSSVQMGLVKFLFSRECKATIPVDLILRLYAIGDKLQTLSALLGNCCNIGKNETSIAFDVECESFLTCGDKKACKVMFYNTLKFLCQPLAELVNLEKKRILAEPKVSSDSSNLCIIQDAFYQFCDGFFSLESCTSETKREEFDDDELLVSSITVAGFIASSAATRNISALKALKLSHRASQKNIQLLREMNDQLSEDALRDLVSESSDACNRTAFHLEVLHACGNRKVEGIFVESLENWSILEIFFTRLAGPMPLIKQWVKIQCKRQKNMDLEKSAPTLCYTLLSSAGVSKRAISKILEQEFLAYQEMNHGYPAFCQRMQNKVIDLLMQNDYAIEDDPLQRARILIRKGRTLRANGIEALKDCISCLSEAISIMKNFSGETHAGTPARHQLAAAYCLHALCTQEAEPNSEQVYEDIRAALKLWSSIFIHDSRSTGDEFKMVSGNTLQLLYNMLDLLSLKGYTEFHNHIYKLLIRIYKLNNVELGKCAANLWECRRLSHALCVSPVNESFITNLSEQCGESSEAVDFWIQRLSDHNQG
ncbi:hypothetical protein V6N12_072519 [Hibiscus sabdariffa]|uniref:Uncharacterized protein n=1 Tax=Hibiscus sabdariffa TaxID=183260 RepID=A0ABR2AZK9_9ROSI